MTDQTTPPPLSSSLRQQAEHHLRTGTARLSSAFAASSDALDVLYRLSSNENTASDGLKLLHELQTYQVELDLQLEQLQLEEREHSKELACYRQFFAICPMACLMLNLDGIIPAENDAAMRLFSQAQLVPHQPEPLCGRPILSLFYPSYQLMLSAALNRVQRNKQSTTLIAPLLSSEAEPHQETRSMQLTINLSPDHSTLLIMLT